ncbi:MAG: hypothetical protein COB08_017760 [Rhodobacteraceae bacterium]|nr:hypothetical protein [Paracoccaceae bacterium]
MDLREQLIELAGSSLNFEIITTDYGILIEPDNEDGFPVEVQEISKTEFIVYLGGWHEHFDDLHGAFSCVSFGLSSKCRLKTHSRSLKEYRWTVQFSENGEWVDESTAGLIFFPYFGKLKIEFHQNRFDLL